jgi:hypothetical protein
VQQHRRVEWRALRRAMVRGITAPYVSRYNSPNEAVPGRSAIEPID